MEFQDQIIVVTGGTRGIGRAVSLHFARLGGKVTAAYLTNEAAAEALVQDAEGLAGKIVTVKADVSTSEGAQALIEAATRETGHLDVLVNNAGILKDVYLPMMGEGEWDAVIRGNLYPLFHCCKWGVRRMIGRRRGAIVNLSSISALAGTAGQTNYAASKGAAISFTRSLAREVGPMGIRANCVAPGLIDTEMITHMRRELVDAIVKNVPLGRIGRPYEVAEAVAFLASERAAYITGQCLVVDGGVV